MRQPSRCLSLLIASLMAGGAMGGEVLRSMPAADGSMAIPAYTVPYSLFASPESKVRFLRMMEENKASPGLGGKIEDSRHFYDGINSDRAARMQKLYRVKLSTQKIAGVDTDVVEPVDGVPADHAARVLINLHGGGFLWGAHSGALVEAIPVASLGKVKVIGVDYRQGPEHVFPAASDDVEAVYKALLKTYKPGNIGIYGCSAGGVLTGEVVARLIHDDVPVPGAIGTFCGSVVDLAGDSTWTAPALNGDPIPKENFHLFMLPYFHGAKADDPLVFPGRSPALLAKFPPTLLITGTRDFTMSAVLQSQRLLANAGVDTDLHVWDGMWHSFFSDPELPESREAYAVMVKFFDRHLGH